MTTLDWIVLGAYFVIMALIGVACWWRIKKQEDFFMGGRSFGKLLQTFAAFGAGTGSNDPVQVGSRVWGSGLAGIWAVLMWLFVTPFYWIFGVWYRRMRHITIGDWYVDRYNSTSLGAAYAVFGTYFYMFYLSAMFTAVVKVAIPLIGADTLQSWGLDDPGDLKFYLIPAMSVLILIYGILGGLKAAYWTDLIQGLGIIILSVILIPTGLQALIDKFDPGSTEGLMRGFEIMHERTPSEYFAIFGGPRSSEFPFHYILSLTLLGLVGIVVQPHFISTGGGSAKNELSARVGLVSGNFLKRFCTIGWALTGLIVLTLMADSVAIASDPDQVWGFASREILSKLGMGLVGLMLACLLAAMMSSADTYMIMTAGLFTRNFYLPVRPNATEKQYLLVGRLSGLIMIVGAAIISIVKQDVFAQFVDAITLPIIFAATFWLGMWWRRANKTAAWMTIVFITVVFFILPPVLPEVFNGLRDDQRFAVKNQLTTTIITRQAKQSDLSRRAAWTTAYERALNNEDAEKGFKSLMTIGVPVVISAEHYRDHKAWQTEYLQMRGEVQAAAKGVAGIQDPDERAAKLKSRYEAGMQQLSHLPPVPPLGEEGSDVREEFETGGKPIFWESLEAVGPTTPTTVSTEKENNREVIAVQEQGQFTGKGDFRVELVVYQLLGMDLRDFSDAELTTMELPPKLILPFVVMILLSLITPRTPQKRLDDYFVKMKVPVQNDPDEDARRLEEAYQDPSQYEHRKLLPGSSIEIQKPRPQDVIGFIICFAICFGIVWMAVWVTNLGAS